MKKNRTLYARQALTGNLFCIPIYIGAVLFLILPIIRSIIYVFAQVHPELGSMSVELIGLENIRYIFREDPDFITNLIASVTNLLYKVPFILIVSLFLAIVVNQKFMGRTLVRAIFFLPTVVASGVVISIIQGDALSATMMSSEETAGIFNSTILTDFLRETGLNGAIVDYFTSITNHIFDLLWKTGVQVLMFLAALQNISPSLYEASAVEGATGWENFWMITFPMLVPIMLVNTVYTVVDTFTDVSGGVMGQIVGTIGNIEYGKASAMGWTYTLVILLVLGIVFYIFKLPELIEKKGKKK